MYSIMVTTPPEPQGTQRFNYYSNIAAAQQDFLSRLEQSALYSSVSLSSTMDEHPLPGDFGTFTTFDALDTGEMEDPNDPRGNKLRAAKMGLKMVNGKWVSIKS